MDCSSLPGLKRTALPGGMLTSAPVRGLRPMPVLRGRTVKTPKPRSSMRSPRASDFFILSNTVSTAISALVLVTPVLVTTSLIRSSLITSGSAGIARPGRYSGLRWDGRIVVKRAPLVNRSELALLGITCSRCAGRQKRAGGGSLRQPKVGHDADEHPVDHRDQQHISHLLFEAGVLHFS